MPFNDSAILTICENSVEIYYVGKNFPCWSYSDILPVFDSEVNNFYFKLFRLALLTI